jgi:hypothetical protein
MVGYGSGGSGCQESEIYFESSQYGLSKNCRLSCNLRQIKKSDSLVLIFIGTFITICLVR